jgi:hypothetical protein
MTRKLEEQLICGGITAVEQLSAAEQAVLETSPHLQRLLAESAALTEHGTTDCPPPPDRQRLLATAFAADPIPCKENIMLPNPIDRLFAGKPFALRLALGGALLIALVAFSLVLPRSFRQGPAAPAWATSEGYLLAFDFGSADLANIQPVIDQLKARVTAFKQAHNIPTGQAHSATGIMSSEKKTIIKHDINGQGGAPAEQQEKRAIVMVSLPDASLIEDLKKELASIPGLPVPQVTDATWFRENGLPDPSQPGINLGINFGEKQHMFNFPETATEQQIQQELDSWIRQNEPDADIKVKVTLTGDEKNRRLEVSIEGIKDKSGPADSSPHPAGS